MEEIRCRFEDFTYQNEETGYRVARCIGDRSFVAVGSIPSWAQPGTMAVLSGEWVTHKKYGKQFSVTSARELLPMSRKGMIRYLSKKGTFGIGKKFATVIVDAFGEDTYNVIDKEPERLLELNGIGKKRYASIVNKWDETRNSRETDTFLMSIGITGASLTKVKEKYGKAASAIIKQNPYLLADDIKGIGFTSADLIASNIGIEKDSPFRIQSCILYALNQMAEGKGDCFATQKQLERETSNILRLNNDPIEDFEEKLDKAVDVLSQGRRIIVDKEKIYLKSYYKAECSCAIDIREISKYKIPQIKVTVNKSKYDSIQKQAIEQAFKQKIMILTGGPGTGKTTIVGEILSICRRKKLRVLLAAPTGRAAKRMSEVTGMEALTIHRLLHYSGTQQHFLKDRHDPLAGDFLIVDESSMIDIKLMESLLDAVPRSMRVLFVGDVDQLPSVGPGNVLRDMIASGYIYTIKLEKIYRQAANSGIIENASLVNKGNLPKLGYPDFQFYPCDNAEEISDTIVYLCNSIHTQVLTPMHSGACGTDILNTRLQTKFNKGKPLANLKSFHGAIGDKVMQIKNDYGKEVFNGDIGYIYSIDKEMITVKFDNRIIEYDIETEMKDLVLAYASSVHKSQGSEYDTVILALSKSHYLNLQRNLFYTGITRAAKKFILVGEKEAVKIAVRNAKIKFRNTYLSERIRQEFLN